MSEEERRSPEEFLMAAKHEASQQDKGKLKIFLGMAAGVGKTYAMLQEAQALNNEGVDIVVGIVDTHGRKETAKLVEGLKIIPEKVLLYRGVELREPDVDAIIALKPEIVLMDELAHNNAPGSKHLKRWQDVVEILDNKINVYTTLNIQHIESLNDIIKGITDISVKETIPDNIVEMASSIQLVDLTPDELLERLEEGKVYLQGQSQIAVANFFQKDKLTALREVVLRYTADKIDYDLRKMIPAKGKIIKWKPREKLLVAVNYTPQSQILIRLARRLATNLDAPWIVLHVDDGSILTEKESEQLYKNLGLARDLGAEIVTVHDLDVAEGIKRIANQQSITHIVVGRTPQNPLLAIFKGVSLVDRLTAECENIDIHVIRQERLPIGYRRRFFSLSFPKDVYSYLFVFLWVALFTTFNWLVLPIIGYKVAGTFFLFSILALSLKYRKGPVLIASVLYGLIWTLFFIPQMDSRFSIREEDTFLIILFCVTAITVGILGDRARNQREMLERREKINTALYDIVTNLLANKPEEEILTSIKKCLIKYLNGTYEIMFQDEGGNLKINDPENLLSSEQEQSTAIWSFQNGKEAGWSTETLPSCQNLYIPIKGKAEVCGLLVYKPDENVRITREEKNFLAMACRHIADSRKAKYASS